MNLGNAQHRASLALQIAQYLCSIDGDKSKDASENGGNDEKLMKRAVEVIREFAQPVEIEEQEHNGMYIIECAMTHVISFIVTFRFFFFFFNRSGFVTTDKRIK